MLHSKSTNKTINTENFIPSILIILFLIVGFIPNFGAVDKIAPQWLYLSILNIISTIYLVYRRNEFFQRIYKAIFSTISILYILFFIWALLSYFYAINQIEVLVNMARQSNTLFMYLHLFIFIYDIKQKNLLVSWFMTLLLAIEVYAVFDQAIEMINTSGVISSGGLKGVTANRNITAFSIALKIPFVIYLFEINKNNFITVLLMILLFFSFVDISLISSRASFIAIGLIFLGFTLLHVHKYLFIKKKIFLKKIVYRFLYFIVPLIMSLIVNQIYFSSKGADAISRAGTIAISTSDDSISKRLRYYEDVMNYISSNPFIGAGIGNWKLESINADKLDIDGYIVPYHAHSDFIQIGAELGLIGFLLYLGIFVMAIYFSLYIFFKSKQPYNNKFFTFILLISLGVYLIDANLNFPIARPQELAPLAIVLAFISFYYNQSKENISNDLNLSSKNIFKYIFPLFALLFSFPALSITHKTYLSHINQLVILNDFNNNTHNIPLNKIESLVSKIPNITVTTIPMDAIKARYYFHYEKYNKSLELLKTSKNQNPYLSYSDALESIIYDKQKDFAKAIKSAEIAFYNLPKNNFHITQYINLIIKLKDKVALEKAFKLLTRNNDLLGWKNYLSALNQISEYGNEIYIKRAKKATELFPEDNDIRTLFKYIAIGQYDIEYANELATKANEKFNNKFFKEAAIFYDKAILVDPYEYSYYENSAISYYSIQDYDKSLFKINEVIKNMNPLNGKCEYIKGLNYLQLGLISDACSLFKTSLASGFNESKNLINQYCKN